MKHVKGPDSSLVSCHLLGLLFLSILHSCSLLTVYFQETAPDGSILWTWSYPNIDPSFRSVCIRKCTIMLQGNQNQQSSKILNHLHGPANKGKEFTRNFHLDKFWFYINLHSSSIDPFGSSTSSSNVPSSDENNIDSLHSNIRTTGMVLVTEDFNPDKYEQVSEILHVSYLKTGNPTTVLKQFLSLIIEGVCQLPKKKTFKLSDYKMSTFHCKHNAKGIISRFGLETIVIYTALLRKKRIVVYHYNPHELNEFIMTLPYLVSNVERNLWNSIYPWIDLNEEEISSMMDIPNYIMGCTQAAIENRHDLHDIFVNIPAAEVNVPQHAKEGISMNKTHKEMAMFMVQSAGRKDATEDEVIDEITKHSISIIDKLLMTRNSS